LLRDWQADFPTPRGASTGAILELGCGPGRFSRYLATRVAAGGGRVEALDKDPAMIARARQDFGAVANLTFLRGDALDVARPDGAYDLVVAASLLNLVAAPARLIAEMCRLVRPGGGLAVLIPTPHFDAQQADRLVRRLRLAGFSAAALAAWARSAPSMAPTEARRLFAEAGLTDIHVHRYLDGAIAGLSGVMPGCGTPPL